MPFLPEMTRLASNDYNGFTTGNSFHTGGVTGSIPVAPTIYCHKSSPNASAASIMWYGALIFCVQLVRAGQQNH